jgi:hypothetical protein
VTDGAERTVMGSPTVHDREPSRPSTTEAFTGLILRQ